MNVNEPLCLQKVIFNTGFLHEDYWKQIIEIAVYINW